MKPLKPECLAHQWWPCFRTEIFFLELYKTSRFHSAAGLCSYRSHTKRVKLWFDDICDLQLYRRTLKWKLFVKQRPQCLYTSHHNFAPLCQASLVLQPFLSECTDELGQKEQEDDASLAQLQHKT